ncbi:MAG: threonine--tRNA ligase [Candidatus Wildermuthbacteria bacterium GWA2_46_15]|uniref:Threonine--tRNA ligase n=1 Tax=Candidatus Wildermuthbacteria bacterium GWA2_46_15 TaxID=1802443 RepID=A0A1G2QN43_9BACT|nr:MAG: threonine--tRNA ligase [Candidatus Wildermuthbacteria bacterium GWA2_46_15]
MRKAPKIVGNPAESLRKMRHSCEHVLTQAMLRLWPGIKMAMGPATEDGFYFDFDPEPAGEGQVHKISETDFLKIEAEMAKIVKADLPIRKKTLTIAEARKLFKGNEYKQEWLDGIKQKKQKPTIYWTGKEFVDLCAGPHVKRTGGIGAFKLLSIAGAYWHGSEKNKMLTRIYGTCFASQKELDNYLFVLEQAKKRDHRKLGRELELFTINDEVGQGLTIWLPKGSTIRREMENFQIEEQIKLGYQHVYSPHIGQKSLWVKSGHWDLYREKMYSPMDVEGTEYLIKPMTCPMHIQSYKFKPRSYRDLPYRIAEIASVYRYEQSGELSGLLRVRAFTQDDAHVFCTPDQAIDEFLSVFNFIKKLYGVFGMKDYRVRLGIRSRKEKYLGNDNMWKRAEEKAIAALKESKTPYFVSEGDAAFYGPKADFLVKDALGREWQCGTVQVDFMLPERFELKYTDKDGEEKTPVMIHRAPLGSLERWLAILIENYEGAFPVWLSPVQAWVIPIASRHIPSAQKVLNTLRAEGLRVELKDENETVGKKIREGEMQKIPYLLIIGDREEKAKTVSLRQRKKGDLGALKLAEFITKIKKEIEQKMKEI